MDPRSSPRRIGPPEETTIARSGPRSWRRTWVLLTALLIPLAPGEGAATTLKDLTASVTLRSSVPCSEARAGLEVILPAPNAGVMCAIGIGGGVPGDSGMRIRRRKLRQPRPARVCDHNEEDNDLPFEESLGKKEFVSDAPFDGPPTGAAIGIGGEAHGLYSKRGSTRTLSDTGVLTAVELGLKWLATKQLEDGNWEGRRLNTGLALLAFLGAGQTHKHGTQKKTVKRGLRHLKVIQDEDGRFAERSKPDWLTEHAILTLAMVEAYGLTGSPLFKQSGQAGIDVLAHPEPAGGATEAWIAIVFRTAKAAGLKVHEDWKGTSLKALKTKASGILPSTHSAADAAFGFARMMAGADPRQNLPDPSGWWRDPIHCHFEGLALFQAGGEHWAYWETTALKTVAKAQLEEFGRLTGSWSPVGPDAKLLGRVGTTALACLTLTTPVRYARITRSR